MSSADVARNERLTLYRVKGSAVWVDNPELPERLEGKALDQLQVQTFISTDEVREMLVSLEGYIHYSGAEVVRGIRERLGVKPMRHHPEHDPQTQRGWRGFP